METLKVEHKLTLIDNMTVVKASIAETIAKYDVVVVEDGLSEAKELMAIFNKNKKDFSSQCKMYLDELSGPIMEFKKHQKEIEAMFDEGRAKIADQVKKFEDEKLIKIAVLIKAYRNMACEAAGFNIESVSIEDLIMLSAVTVSKKGMALTKAAKENIDGRIKAVEIEVLKAKVAAEEKANYEREIAEKARIEAEARARVREAELIAKAEREKHEALAEAKRQQDEAVQAEKNRAESVPKQETLFQEDTPKKESLPSGKIRAVLTFEFEIKGKPSDEAITGRVKEQITDVFKEYLISIEVER